MKFQQLCVNWGACILDVQECTVYAKYGEHTWANVKAIGKEGNMMYNMPELGTRAGLSFSSPFEKTGEVIYNIRENGEQCREMDDSNHKYLTTDYGKRLYWKPSQMGFIHLGEKRMEIGFQDKRDVHMKAASQFMVTAKGQIEVKGKNVILTALREATLVKKDFLFPTVVNLSNTFDAIGKNAGFTSTDNIVKKKRKPHLDKIEEPYSLEGVTQHILSNIPVPRSSNSILEGVIGSMPIMSTVRLEEKEGRKAGIEK